MLSKFRYAVGSIQPDSVFHFLETQNCLEQPRMSIESANRAFCPLYVAQGEMDPSAVNVDCFGSVAGDALAGFYAPAGVEVPHSSFGVTQLEAKIRGALLMPYSLTTLFRALPIYNSAIILILSLMRGA